jgi:pyrroloquinoline quinone (PQQ) biosynthesis protein C
VSSRTDVVASESERLRDKIELVLPELIGASRRLVDDPRIADLYPEYLFTLHSVIRASVPLMETARERARKLAKEDPVCEILAPYLDEHIPEEADHDEWLLEDLELLGEDRSSVLARPPSPTVAATVGAQYYWILHYHPVALLGYIALLEGYPPSIELVDELVDRTGHSRAAFRTLIAHAELDPGHRDELDAVLDHLPVTREQSTAMGLSAIYSVQMLARAIDELRNGFAGPE